MKACAVIEAPHKWFQFLIGRHFTLITDQRSVAFMFDQKNRSKIKTTKLLVWRLKLSQLTRPVTSLGHPVGRRVFWEGPKFF